MVNDGGMDLDRKRVSSKNKRKTKVMPMVSSRMLLPEFYVPIYLWFSVLPSPLSVFLPLPLPQHPLPAQVCLAIIIITTIHYTAVAAHQLIHVHRDGCSIPHHFLFSWIEHQHYLDLLTIKVYYHEIPFDMSHVGRLARSTPHFDHHRHRSHPFPHQRIGQLTSEEIQRGRVSTEVDTFLGKYLFCVLTNQLSQSQMIATRNRELPLAHRQWATEWRIKLPVLARYDFNIHLFRWPTLASKLTLKHAEPRRTKWTIAVIRFVVGEGQSILNCPTCLCLLSAFPL